ncbi:MAG: hypothetical protein H7Y17_13105 [Chlorobia bacterium]|nr:hypothetical protein [Fimbriimonadaceae bacterium]
MNELNDILDSAAHWSESNPILAVELSTRMVAFAAGKSIPLTDPQGFISSVGSGCVSAASDVLKSDGSARTNNSKAHAQALDPATVLSVGFVLIGLVLAARLKRIRKEEASFFEGVPKEIVDVITAGERFLGTSTIDEKK